MAALIASEDYVLMSNGSDVGVVLFSSPDVFLPLTVPCFEAQSRGKPPTHTKAKNKGKEDGQNGKDGEKDGGEQNETKESSAAPQPNYIRAMAISHSGSYVAICDDRKYLHIFKRVTSEEKWSIFSSRPTARRCTSACFSPDDSLVLVADKSGDAYYFQTLEQGKGQGQVISKDQGCAPGDDSDSAVTQQKLPAVQSGSSVVPKSGDKSANGGDGGNVEAADDVAVDDDIDKEDGEDVAVHEGTLMLGHLSMLLGVMLVDSGRLVVTCDRDEKIRISRFPDAYNIHAYCLGHTEFVIGLAYDASRKVLLSASGDCTIRAWTLDGVSLGLYTVLQDLPKDTSGPKPVNSTTAADTTATNQSSNDESCRPSIKQIVYCEQCSLLFVTMENSPHILVYRLTLEPSSPTPGSASLSHVTTLTTPGSSSTVESVSMHGCSLWVLTQARGGNELHLEVYTVVGGGDVKIDPVSKESMHNKIVTTFSRQSEFRLAQKDPSNLLKFLWKSNFQDEFTPRSQGKRHSDPQNGHEGQENHTVTGGKKARDT